MLHPSIHEFWKNENIRKEFFEFLASWSKNLVAYFKKTFTELGDGYTKANGEEEIELDLKMDYLKCTNSEKKSLRLKENSSQNQLFLLIIISLVLSFSEITYLTDRL